MLHRSLSSLEEGDRVQRQGRGPHSGEQKVQEGRQGLEEEEEEEEGVKEIMMRLIAVVHALHLQFSKLSSSEGVKQQGA